MARAKKATREDPNAVSEYAIRDAKRPQLQSLPFGVFLLVALGLHAYLMYLLYEASMNVDLAWDGSGGDFVVLVVPFFLISIVLEVLYDKAYGLGLYRVNDSVGSLSTGTWMILLKKLWSRHISFVPYLWVWRNYRVTDFFMENGTAGFVLQFLIVEFFYYWIHRTGHTFHCFWAMHGVHHSSEEYNLSTALRQSSLHGLASNLYHVPSALFFPPKQMYLQAQFNLIYQFWIHSCTFPKLGVLEYVLNTPSQHRVHHGRNAYCIDKNYGGTLCIFDRLFNSFEEERDDDPVVFGITHGQESFNTIYINTDLWTPMVVENGVTTWYDTILRFYYGPGWVPGTHYEEYQIPPVNRERQQKLNPYLPFGMQVYLSVNFLFTLVLSLLANDGKVHPDMPDQMILICLFATVSVTLVASRSKFAPMFEFIRHGLMVLVAYHVFCGTEPLYFLLALGCLTIPFTYFCANLHVFSVPLSASEVGRDRTDEEVLAIKAAERAREKGE
mmetsp:Transcript_9297/g.26071  ORF Transcript_9297/g.26071 Transcript_9297/m.26071 type:complete len:499 (+) Transcript_9297:213-1709(+)|eukprot:CAMPEP_0119120578 /NCGR_PEP_ID=MMETSP1310-20130426/1555_1 /TAXON_ID=464262 /ORGANISM="Genus nov. species nov., Strain RCC2339" /LENGTH=498 /DNA_ID=CAMNT_0007110065 /DNA_START=191 /DNA_END=1687 /DNA_ORIENTATION=+